MFGTSVRVDEATIAAVHAAMLTGGLTCVDLVDAYLRRVDQLDRHGPRLGAIVSVCDQARGRAQELDHELEVTGRLSGPLHGVPVLVKDCIETVDAPTTFGSIAARGYKAHGDAEVVRRLRAAGAVVLAKTALCDFAAGWFSHSSLSGETKNPYALERDSGGSSAGSAAGVAANLGLAAVGTDCGGSIRVPASFCNLVGLRTTPGVIPHDGTLPLVARQDTIGPLARSVIDAAQLLAVLAEEGTAARRAAAAFISRGTGATAAVRNVRIGVLRTAFGEGHPEMGLVNGVVMSALETFASSGVVLVDVTIPSLRSDLEATSMYLLRSRIDLEAFFATRPGLPVHRLREVHDQRLYDARLDLIDAIVAASERPATDADFARGQAAREAFTRRLTRVMDRNALDVLAYPSVQVLAPHRDRPLEWTTLTFPTNTVIASQAWMPALSLPAGFTSGGVPVGLELLARQHDEAQLLDLGGAFERLAPHRQPPRGMIDQLGGAEPPDLARC